MFTGLNLSNMIFSQDHRQPPGASPAPPVMIKKRIILFSVSFSALPVRYLD